MKQRCGWEEVKRGRKRGHGVGDGGIPIGVKVRVVAALGERDVT